MTPRHLLLTTLLCLSAPVLAQQADGGDDAGPGSGLPDASAGEGCADCGGEEGEGTVGRVVTRCEFSSDCTRGFACQAGKCVWGGGYRDAEGGCLCDFTGAALALMMGIVGLAWRSTPRRRESRGDGGNPES